MADVPKLVDTVLSSIQKDELILQPLFMCVLMCKSTDILEKYEKIYNITCPDKYPTTRFIQLFMGVTEKTAINTIKFAIDRGWVEQIDSPIDQRSKYIKATKKLDDLNYKLSIL